MSIVIKAPSGGGSISLDTQQSVTGDHTLQLPTGVGSAGQVLKNSSTPGTLEFGTSYELTKGTKVDTTSGTASLDFTGIPSYAKRITVMFDGVSCSSGQVLFIQIGDSGGIEATGYVSGAFTAPASGSFASATTTFVLSHSVTSVASNAFYGSVILSNLDGNTWTSQGVLHVSPTYGCPIASAGTKTLSGTLDRLRIGFSTGNFDAGKVNIMYEG